MIYLQFLFLSRKNFRRKTIDASRPRQCLFGASRPSFFSISAQRALIPTQVNPTHNSVFSTAARCHAALAMSLRAPRFGFSAKSGRPYDRSRYIFRCFFFLFAHLFFKHVIAHGGVRGVESRDPEPKPFIHFIPSDSSAIIAKLNANEGLICHGLAGIAKDKLQARRTVVAWQVGPCA